MNNQQKQEIISVLKGKLKNYVCVILADFQGMDVAAMQKLRQETRRNGIELMVVKNTLFDKASSDFDFARDLRPYLKGMTAVAWSPEDPSTPAKVIKDFQKEDERLKIKCGILEGKVINPEDVNRLAMLPGKEQIMANLLSMLIAPAQQFLALLQAPHGNFLGLLLNYKNKKEDN